MDYRNDQDQTLPRGIRNNNPGNFKKDSPLYQGVTGNDGTFYIFADMTWGIRAIGVDLKAKITKDGLNTIRGIISKYAPAVENNTEAYIAAVSADSGFGPDDPLTADPATLAMLARAIINHENGDIASMEYVSDADLQQGIAMMGASAAQVLQAGIIAAQANPGTTLGLVAGGVLLLYLISSSLAKSDRAR